MYVSGTSTNAGQLHDGLGAAAALGERSCIHFLVISSSNV